jgi:hypothetical protein
MRIRCLAFSTFFIFSGVPLAAQSAVERLVDSINSNSYAWEAVARYSIEAGPAAIPRVREAFERADDEKERILAIMALGYIGGNSAVMMLTEEFEVGTPPGAGASLAFALSSEDSAENRVSLRRLLESDPTTDARFTIEQASFALGILRAKEALSALESIAARDSRFVSGHAASEAIRWINKGYWEVALPLVSEQDSVVGAVLRNGVPGLYEDHYYEDRRGGYWKYGTSGWTLERSEPDGEEDRNWLSFDTFISSDGTRALVSVGFRCKTSFLCGHGYDYVLRKDGGEWRVQKMKSTWIS